VRIVVCIKLVPDPEAPVSAFSIEEPEKVVIEDYVPWFFGPYDESAIEAALRLKEEYGGEVILLSLDPTDIGEKMVEAMATGADRSILVEDRNYDRTDSYGAARTLAAAIRKIGHVDLVLCGRQASDTDAGIVAPALAGFLDCASVAVVRSISNTNGSLVVEQQSGEGTRTLEVFLPAVLSVTSENYTLRYASLASIMEAAEKEVQVWEIPELLSENLTPGEKPYLRCLSAQIPDTGVECKIIDGDSEEAKVNNLFAELQRDRIL